jgi:hypothetical protein
MAAILPGSDLKNDRPRPVSRKTSEDGVKKSFLFDPGFTGRV